MPRDTVKRRKKRKERDAQEVVEEGKGKFLSRKSKRGRAAPEGDAVPPTTRSRRQSRGGSEAQMFGMTQGGRFRSPPKIIPGRSRVLPFQTESNAASEDEDAGGNAPVPRLALQAEGRNVVRRPNSRQGKKATLTVQEGTQSSVRLPRSDRSSFTRDDHAAVTRACSQMQEVHTPQTYSYQNLT